MSGVFEALARLAASSCSSPWWPWQRWSWLDRAATIQPVTDQSSALNGINASDRRRVTTNSQLADRSFHRRVGWGTARILSGRGRGASRRRPRSCLPRLETARTEAEEESRARRAELREQRADLERREQRLSDREEERLDADIRMLEEGRQQGAQKRTQESASDIGGSRVGAADLIGADCRADRRASKSRAGISGHP